MNNDILSCLIYGVADELGMFFDEEKRKVVQQIWDEMYDYAGNLIEDGVLKWRREHAKSTGKRITYYIGTKSFEGTFVFDAVEVDGETPHEISVFTVAHYDEHPDDTGILRREFSCFVPEAFKLTHGGETNEYKLFFPAKIVEGFSDECLVEGESITDKDKIPLVEVVMTYFNLVGVEKLVRRMEVLVESKR